ncbi:8915_t:CDS:2, partial [Racocetra persica]
MTNIRNYEDYIEDFLVDEFYSENDSNLGSLSDLSITSLLLEPYLEDYSNLVSLTDSLTTSLPLIEAVNNNLVSLTDPSTTSLLLIKAVDNSISEGSDFDDRPEDSSLKEIYSRQTFTFFDILKQCLKYYSTQIGFETKIVRSEKEYVLIQSEKALFNIKLIPSCWYLEESLAILDENQESSIQVVRNEDSQIFIRMFQTLEKIHRQDVDNKIAVKLDSKKVSYGHGLRLCKKVLDLVITNGTNKAFKNLLQQFIGDQ